MFHSLALRKAFLHFYGYQLLQLVSPDVDRDELSREPVHDELNQDEEVLVRVVG